MTGPRPLEVQGLPVGFWVRPGWDPMEDGTKQGAVPVDSMCVWRVCPLLGWPTGLTALSCCPVQKGNTTDPRFVSSHGLGQDFLLFEPLLSLQMTHLPSGEGSRMQACWRRSYRSSTRRWWRP